jgi:hypothetical protein
MKIGCREVLNIQRCAFVLNRVVWSEKSAIST